jgi:SH3-like domain-containing protein
MSLGDAYAGPAKLPIRQEISLHSTVVGTVNHGDRLEILSQRRRFTHVRTASGIDGWVDERNLMDQSEMDNLQQMSTDLKTAPSQGQATVYEDVNVHTEPQRASPSYLLITPSEKVDVIGHRWTARVDPPRKTLVKPAPKPVPSSHKGEKQTRIPPPPRPTLPAPPPNWVDLSKQRSFPKPPTPPTPAVLEEALPKDDWSLIRNAAGQTGWVLTRRLTMAIPDEVAQYAEGHRITSYFSLGKVTDGDNVKETWLWTTIAGGEHYYDFDGYRVFIWSLRHHRYETAYIQRRMEGYAPVLRNTVSGHPGFSVCIENNGQRIRRQYVMIENAVKAAGDMPCVPGVRPASTRGAAGQPAPSDAAPGHGLQFMLRKHLDLLKQHFSGNQ